MKVVIAFGQHMNLATWLCFKSAANIQVSKSSWQLGPPVLKKKVHKNNIKVYINVVPIKQ